jgi:hypothetical protein
LKTISGAPKFDSIFLGEIQIDLHATPDIRMQAVAGYLDSKTGRRFGSTTKMGSWSPDTLLKLNALIESIETDVAADIFEGVATGGGDRTIATPIDGVPGL